MQQSFTNHWLDAGSTGPLPSSFVVNHAPAGPFGEFIVVLALGGGVGVEFALLFALAPLAAVGQGHVLQRVADPLFGADSGYHALAEITARKSVPL